jgi:DNA-binding beta-propeller fold protein YncE
MKVFTTGILFLILCASAQAQTTDQLLTLDKTIPLTGVKGRIDHMAVDVAGQRLFVAALENNSVEVLDLKTGQLVTSITNFDQPQGIVYVPEFDKLFVANGSDGTCRILDGHSFKTLNSLDLGDDADNVRYDAGAKKVYVGYGSGGLAAIDAKTGEKTSDIPLAAHPESFRMDSDSPNLYVNVPEAGQIAVVDRVKGTVVDTWPLKEAHENFPMVLDEANNRVFVGCRKPATVLVYNFHGRVLQSIPIADDTDDLFYDARNKLIYATCGAGSITVIRQVDVDNYQKMKRILTSPDARTSLFIPELNLLCVAAPGQNKGAPAQVLVYKTP